MNVNARNAQRPEASGEDADRARREENMRQNRLEVTRVNRRGGFLALLSNGEVRALGVGPTRPVKRARRAAIENRSEVLPESEGSLHAQQRAQPATVPLALTGSEKGGVRREPLVFPPPPSISASRRSSTMASIKPPTDLQTVVDSEIKEWHFHIYFHQNNSDEHAAAMELRDAVLRLRRDGAFVAVPLFRVNMYPIGPHPCGSYEIWCPSESFAPVFSYLCQYRGSLSVLVHPLTKEERADHEVRNAWIGPSFPLDLAQLPVRSEEVPSQYHSLNLGYSSKARQRTIEERRLIGANVEAILRGEKEAARAPTD